MITRINVLKTLAKDLSCKCKCRFLGRKCNLGITNVGIMLNVYLRVKNVTYMKMILSGIQLHVIENEKYLANIMDDSAIVFDEVIELYDETIKAISTNFNEIKATRKTKNF